MGFLDNAGLAHLWEKIKGALAVKQDAITGAAGQVVGFDANGGPVAQDAPESGMTEEEADKRYLRLTDGVVIGYVRIGGEQVVSGLILDGPDQNAAPPTGLGFTSPSEAPCMIQAAYGVLHYTPGTNNESAGSINTGAPVLLISGRMLSLENELYMNRFKIREIGDPEYPYDAVTKEYVDGLVGGIETILASI